MKKTEFFKIEGDKINRIRKYCPKCGPAVFLADHKDRYSCGKCGYTEFKGGNRPIKPSKIEEKPVEEKVEPIPETPAQEPQKEEPPKEEVTAEGPEEKKE